MRGVTSATIVVTFLLASVAADLGRASATTVIRAERPSASYSWVWGTNGRNHSCNALACEDRTYLERHTWSGWRKQVSTERHASRRTGAMCKSGSHNYKTAHRARYLIAGHASITIGVGPFTVGRGRPTAEYTDWFGDWSGSRRKVCWRHTGSAMY